MIESGTANRSNSRWLQACVLLLAVAVLPLGLAYAREPDYEAVGRRLRAAVEAGELTGEQARAMLGKLRDASGAKKDERPDRDRVDAYLRETWAKLQAAVKTGKMSQEDAHRKMGEIKAEAQLKETWAKLQAAVKAGKMSEKDAHEKMGAMKREVFARLKGRGERDHGKGDRAREYLMKVRRELGEAVKAGKISREDAAKRYAGAEKAIRERMAAGRGQTRTKRITEEDLSRAGIEIRKAVAAGKISKEQARAKMEAMRKMMGRQGERQRGGERKRTTRERQPERRGGRAVSREERLRIWRNMSEAERTRLREQALRRMGGRRKR